MVYYPLHPDVGGYPRNLGCLQAIDAPKFSELLGNGNQWGIELSYAVQPNPGGLAQAFIVGRDFLGENPSALVLGDNIFYGHELPVMMRNAAARTRGCRLDFRSSGFKFYAASRN